MKVIINNSSLMWRVISSIGLQLSSSQVNLHRTLSQLQAKLYHSYSPLSFVKICPITCYVMGQINVWPVSLSDSILTVVFVPLLQYLFLSLYPPLSRSRSLSASLLGSLYVCLSVTPHNYKIQLYQNNASLKVNNHKKIF